MNNVIEYVTCPQCGNQFDDNFRKCPKCKAKNRDMICRGCGAQINASEKKCPYCGKRHKKRRSVIVQVLMGVLLTILAFFTLIIALAFIFGSKTSDTPAKTEQKPAVEEKQSELRTDKTDSANEAGKADDEDKVNTAATLLKPKEFNATGYVFISADRIFEFGEYMIGERVITEITASDVGRKTIKSYVTDDEHYTYDIICEFDNKINGIPESSTIIVAGVITEAKGSGKPVTIENCKKIPDASYELRDDPQKQQEHCEALRQEVIDAQVAAIEREKNAYTADCEELSYSAVSRDPEDYEGKKVVITGTVIQVQEGFFDSVTLRVETSEGIWYVMYTRKDGESRILEDDRITCYGECKGVETYIALLGNTVTIPSMRMEYYDLETS